MKEKENKKENKIDKKEKKKELKEQKKIKKKEIKEEKIIKKQKKEEENSKRKKTSIFVWWFFWIIYLEIIYRVFIIGDFWSINTLSVIEFCVPTIIVLTIITSLFSEKINKILNIVFSTALAVLILAQIVYFNFYHSIFSFFSLTNGAGQVMQFWQMILEIIKNIWYVFLLVLIPLILSYIFNKKLFDYKRPKLIKYFIFLIIMNLSIIGIMLQVKSSYGMYCLDDLLHKTHAPMLTINKTGLFAMQGIDFYRYVFGFEEQLTYDDDTDEEIVIEPEIEYNVSNINFDKLISKTNDKTLIKMHKYFKSVQPTEKNDFTGVFKGKNIIFITAEGFDKIALDKELTPTLYKMANTGFVFNNYYQPLYPVSTSDGEYMNLTSLIPKEGVWSFYRSSKVNMKMSYPNVFKKNGYTTYGFHNHTYKYYDRHLSHPNIGLKYIGCGNGLEKKMNCNHWPNSDIEMIKATTDYYFKKQPFATYYMTVSGHLEYNFGGNNMASKNRSLVQNLKTSEAVKAYMATQIELDKAMETLLKRLEKAKLIDDTLIVIAPDHYPYGLTTKQLNERSKSDRSDKFENYHTTLIMYNPNLRQREINTVVSSLDIVPTLYNLFGLEYDSRLVMGRDIFSKEEHIVILSDRSWITDKGTYNSVNGKFKSFTKEKVSKDYINRINKIVNKKVSMSALVLDKNYYKAVGLK